MQGPSAECCAAGGADKVQSGVLGGGSESCLSDLPLYEAPCFDSRSKVGVIVVYDVFAFKVGLIFVYDGQADSPSSSTSSLAENDNA